MSDVEPWRIPQTMADRAVEEWEHHGIKCIVTPVLGRCTFNGYALCPPDVLGRWQALKRIGPPITIPGDAPYGPDREGWIGFSTASANDVWAEADLTGFFSPAQIADHDRDLKARDELQGMLSKQYGTAEYPVSAEVQYHTWTRRELHERVNDLAVQIAVRRAMMRIGRDGTRPMQARLDHAVKTYGEMCAWIEAEREKLRPDGGYFSLPLLEQQAHEDATFNEVVLKFESEFLKEQ